MDAKVLEEVVAKALDKLDKGDLAITSAQDRPFLEYIIVELLHKCMIAEHNAILVQLKALEEKEGGQVELRRASAFRDAIDLIRARMK